MPTRTQAVPAHKSLGTGYNLRPDTRPVPARALVPGDVVMEGPEHPAVIIESRMTTRGWLVKALYIWQKPSEQPWIMGRFAKDHLIARAVEGEY